MSESMQQATKPREESPGTGDGEGARRCWVDVSLTAKGCKRRSKLHVAYDGNRFYELKQLTKLRYYDEIYIDTLFPEIYGDVAKLLKKEVKVHLLRDTKLLKRIRTQLNLKKNDYNDAIALSKIPKESFREVTLEEIETAMKLQPFLQRFDAISRERQVLMMWIHREDDEELKAEKKVLYKKLTSRYKKLQRSITRIAMKVLPLYALAERELGLRGASLAHLLMRIDFSKGIGKIKGYVRENHKVRGILARYATSIYENAKKGKTGVNNKYSQRVLTAPNEKEALKQVQMEVLKDLRLLWKRHFSEGG